jgi:hypothetical protein
MVGRPSAGGLRARGVGHWDECGKSDVCAGRSWGKESMITSKDGWKEEDMYEERKDVEEKK